jgi:hypothetical protein
MRPHRSLFSQYPLFQLAVAFAGGICAANYLAIKLSIGAGAVCSAIALGLVLKRRLQPAGLLLLAAVFFTGTVLANLETRTTASSSIRNLTEQSCTLTGWLDGPPEFARDRLYLSLHVERISIDGNEEPTPGRVSLLAPLRNANIETTFRDLQLRYGARIRVTTTLDRAGNYSNPGVSTSTNFSTVTATTPADNQKSLLQSLVLTTQKSFHHSRGSTTGERDYKNRSTRASRRKLQACSTPHCSAIATTFHLRLRALSRRRHFPRTRHQWTAHQLHRRIVFLIVWRLTRSRLLQFMFPAVIVWAYSLAVGADASVVRAA